jgi:hypothetical protein
MAKESTETKVTETAEAEVTETAASAAGTDEAVRRLLISREKFKSKGKEYWSYVVKGKIRGREMKVDFEPLDKGGFEFLDIVFDGAQSADLAMIPFEFKDNSGKKVSGIRYEVQSADEYGEYKIQVKPARSSDLAILNSLLSIAERAQGQG